MDSFISRSIRRLLILLVTSLLVIGCSGSNDSASVGSEFPADVAGTDESTTGSGAESTTGSSGLETPNTTRVNVDITVPAYMSDALQVRLVWGDVDATAVWNRDELWTVSADFPTNTTNQLAVTFSDGNGAITLGSYETDLRMGTNAIESIQITADQFNTERWDSDGDGASNLSELTTGSNPQGEDLPNPILNDLEILPIKTVRISWQATPGAEFYRVLENSDGISGFEQIGVDLEPLVQSYDHRIALYARTNAMYMVQACDAFMCSDSEAQAIVGSLTNAIGYFKPSSIAFSNFGTTVSLSGDGTTLAVGSSSDGSSAIGINGDPTPPNPTSFGSSGAVYVFVDSAEGWVLQAYVKASDSAQSMRFGIGLSLSDDGNTMAVSRLSHIYLFERSNNEWQETTKLEAGTIMSLSGDGNTLAARNAQGNILVFGRSNGTWQQQAMVEATVESEFNSFKSISLSRDGNTLAAGVLIHDSHDAVYLFERNDDIWVQKAFLNSSDPDGGDRFGAAAGLSADGKTLVVGTSGYGRSTGAAYIFFNDNGDWAQQAYLKASNPDVSDEFGVAVSISANGNIVAIGARNERSVSMGINGDENDNSRDRPGAVYVYARSNGSWQQQAYVKAKNTAGFAWFGESVSLSADGSALAVGASHERGGATGVGGDETDIRGGPSGAAYLY